MVVERVRAHYRGPGLELSADDPRGIVSALLRAAESSPDAGVVVVGEGLLKYPELLERARRILTGLRAHGVGRGDHVVLSGLGLTEFFPAFWACVLGGIKPAAIADPAEEGSPAAERLRHTWRLLGEPLVLTGSTLGPSFRMTTVDECLRHEPAAELVEHDDDDVVLLMLSSGSTGAPKAAQLTQRALVEFAASSRRILDVRSGDVSLNWLPPDHSGAFLLYHLLEVFTGCTNVHVPTSQVLADPACWPALMAEYRVNHSWSPTFGLQLAADAVEQSTSDLSSLRTLVTGGEQVLLPVVQRFLDVFGLGEDVVLPVWGMAETTTAITYGRLSEPGAVQRVLKSSLDGELVHVDESTPGHTMFVAVGPPAHETDVRVVDEHDTVLTEDRIGRLQVRSARVTPGYLHNPDATRAALRDGWLDTGDLAYLSRGQVVITGRHNDVIVLNGDNHFAHEIEGVAATVPGVRAGDVAACGIPDGTTGSEALAVFFVSSDDEERIAADIRRVLYTRLRLAAAHVVPVADFPRTPAGKIQRGKLRDRISAPNVAQIVNEVLGTPVDEHKPFYDAGMTSVLLVKVRARLERELGREIPQTAFFEHPTVAALTAFLSQGEEVPAPAPSVPGKGTAIAIIGVAARFPGADTADEFWANLRDGVDSTRTFRAAEADRVFVMGAIDDADCFDAEFFGMSPREAQLTSPAQRLFLQCCYHALEDGGYAVTAPGTRVGVFAGSGMNLYGGQPGPSAESDMMATIGSQPDFLATRVSYRLGLTGPAIGVQTACSTSLVAVHLGVQALLNDEADLVLAGAAAVHTPQDSGYRTEPGSILSSTGRCRPFDAAADGTVGGNGVAAVVLKRLDHALADGDTVHAVILGSAVNNDGAGKVGFAAPSVSGQVDVVRRALRKAGVSAKTVSYVEAHGTGTELGDPVEFTALSRAFAEDTGRTGFCALGSVKAGIGHLDSCAGMAGLIKTVLMLRHRQIVPTLHQTRPNPALPLASSPFTLATSLREWTSDGPRRAGVSALGVGGTNAHVVLEEAPARVPSAVPAGPVIVPLSARNPESLATLADRLRLADVRPADATLTMALGRPHLPHRAAFVGTELITPESPLGQLVFAFSGQGSAFYGMARELYARFPVVQEVIDEAERVRGGLRELLVDRTHAAGEVWPTETAQPALFAFEVALARLWESFGIRPDLLAGHSIGEYAALCVGGALSLADGVRLTASRGELMTRHSPAGGMLAARADSSVAQEIAQASGTEVAAVNGPTAHVLAGDELSLGRAETLLDRAGVRWRRLPVDRAFHTALLDDALTRFRVPEMRPMRVPFVSGVDGRIRPAGWRPDAEYLVLQARQPVRFDLVMSATDGHDHLEVGPGEVLTGTAAHASDGRWLPCQRSDTDSVTALWQALGHLYVRGAEVSWEAVVTGGDRVPLPGYPFTRTRFALEETQQAPSGPLDAVRGVVANVLGAQDVAADSSFFELGADSLSLMTLSREMEKSFGVRVPARTLFTDADTPRKLAALVQPAPEPVAPEPVAVSSPDVQDVVGRQLKLSERLVELMERQLALLTGTAPEPAPPPKAEPMSVPVAVPVPEPEPLRPSTSACDFSLYFFGDYPEQQVADKYGLINAATEFADQHDFHAVWLPERHFHSFGALFPNPSVLAASLAARTSSIRLHAGSVVLPLHNPIRVAEEWSVVDNLSGGRAGLCVASGWHANDFALAPQNFGEHRELMYEQLDTVRRLWSGDAVPATSGSGERIEVRLNPRPIQQQPPMFVAVVGNPESYRRAAREDLGVVTNLMAQTVEELAANIALYRRTRAEHGLDPAAGRVVVLVHTYLDADANKAREEAYRPFCDYLRSSLSLFNQVTNSLGFDVDLDNTPEADVDFLLGRAYQRYCEARALIGDERTAAAITDRLVAAGANEIACFVDFGVAADRVLAALPAVDRLRVRYSAPRLPLSPAQRRIWFLEQTYPGTSAYHEPKAIRLDGPLDVEALTGALRQVVNRHPELRTVFRDDDGEPFRVVLPEIDLDCPVLDFTGARDEDALRTVLETDGKQVLDLTEGPLVLARLLRLSGERHLLFLLVHHIVFDSSSTAVFARDLAAHYRGASPSAVDARVAPEPDAVVRERDLAYWRQRLADLPVLRLPTDRPRPAVRSGAGASLTRELDVPDGLRRFGAEQRVTPFMSLLSAIGVVLGQFSGQDDVVVGTAVANRPPGAEDEVGMFLDTVALRMDLSGDQTFAQLVHQVREHSAAAYSHREVAFDELVGELNPERDLSRNPLFGVLVEFENEGEVDFAPLDATLLDVPSDRAPFDISLYLTHYREGVRCAVEYDSELFDEDTILRLLDYVEHALRQGIRDPHRKLAELTSLTPADEAALSSWQGSPVDAPAECLHELVEQQVRRTPDAVALVGGETEVSYRELDQRANRLAHCLRSRGIGAGDLVAVLLPRGVSLITTLLGVLKSGAAYVPMDTSAPAARLSFLASDSGASLLVTTQGQPDLGVPALFVEDVSPDLPDTPVASSSGPADPAYCIYTSGSTGRPKGVLVPHRGPVNLLRWHQRTHEPLRTAQWTSVAFDISVQEIFTTLASGAALVLLDSDERHDVASVVARHGVQRLFMPFTPLKYLVESQPELPSLREVVSAGEAVELTPALRSFLAQHPLCALHNQYGPTEASIIVTSHLVDPEGESRVPIGAPIPGVGLRVTDPSGVDVPVGAIGEIRIGGIAVANGYLGRPAETAAAFTTTGYRTGDLGRWRSDGVVEFLGRLDDQVKIRGHRVEPGEVRAALSEVDGVVDAAVVVRRDAHGEAELVAYVVSASDVTALAARLAERLPDHLVPGRWARLDRLPYNVNGKLDHSRLPAPATAARPVDGPATSAERAVHDTWCAELGVSSVSVTRSFFELGGHSLGAIRLVNRIAREHGIRVSMTDFFRAPTVRALAARLGRCAVPATEPLRRLWRRHHQYSNPAVYNVAHRVDISGSLDVSALRRAFTSLVGRHEALRLRMVDAESFEIMASTPVELPVTDLTVDQVDQWCQEQADIPFALDCAPLYRFALGRLADRWVLMVVLNHAICDAWSLGVLWHELSSLYEGAELPPPAAQLSDHAQSSPDPAATDFWQAELAGAVLPLRLPSDRPRPAQLSGRGGFHEFTIGAGVASRVSELATSLGSTPYVLLLSAFATWAGAMCGRSDLVVAASSANRLRQEHENVVGLIGDAVLLRARLSGDFAELVTRMGRTLYSALDHQSLPLSDVVSLVDPSVAAGLFPTTLFTVVTTPPPALPLAGALTSVRGLSREGLARNEFYVVLMPSDDGIKVAFEYSTDLFDPSTVVQWGEGLAATLAELVGA